MRLRTLLQICGITGAIASDAVYGQIPAVSIYENHETCFRLEIPEGWVAYDPPFCRGEMRHRWSVAAVNNRGDSTLQVCRWFKPIIRYARSGPYCVGGSLIGPFEAAIGCLSPGTVILEFNVFAGGPPPSQVPYVWDSDDFPQARIADFLNAPAPIYESADLTTFHVGFTKCARSWSATINCRKPFSNEDLQTCFRILGSLQFPEVPVREKAHAVELAIPRIPSRAIHEVDPEEECVRWDLLYELLVSEEGDGYRVTYTQLDGTEEVRPLRAYRYFVDRDAKVRLLASRTGKRFPESEERLRAKRLRAEMHKGKR